MSRRKRPRPMLPATPPRITVERITVDEANELAEHLILDLTEHAGNRHEVGATLMQWLDAEEDLFRFAFVCMAALQQTYAECLTRVPPGTVPPGSTILTTPERETAA